MRYILLLVFVIVPIVEIGLFLQVGSLIGVPATLGLIILTAILGTILVRSQGMEVLRKIQTAAQNSEVPVDALVQGLFVLVAGILLLTPGFATDALGFALLVPAIRTTLSTRVWKLIKPGIVTGADWHQHRRNPANSSTVIIDAEAVEIEDADQMPTKNSIERDKSH